MVPLILHFAMRNLTLVLKILVLPAINHLATKPEPNKDPPWPPSTLATQHQQPVLQLEIQSQEVEPNAKGLGSLS